MPRDLAFSRRNFLLSSVSLPVALRSAPRVNNPLLKLAGAPNFITAFTENDSLALSRNNMIWQGREIQVRVTPHSDGTDVTLRSPTDALLRIHLRWQCNTQTNLQFLGDDWERSYGTLGWRGLEPERILPWYFLAFDGTSTFAAGVATATAAFCFWQVDSAGVSLWLDVRNGGRGVRLGQRELSVVSIAAELYPDSKPFLAAKRFCQRLCASPRLPKTPIYGGNNWYYAYGHSSAEAIRADSGRIASLAKSLVNRPFMIIDDGWQPNPTAGPWSQGNELFPDMQRLASQMQNSGVRPGLWVRPLFTKTAVPSDWRLHSPNAAREYSTSQAFTLDPTVPEALSSVTQDVRAAAAWGYQLIKHDFSTYDLLGRWGFRMGAEITDANWSFADTTRTNAEIIRDFYLALRQAAGETLLLGCNTVGHLSAGVFELQRTGDDTSGRDWNRTRKMGVNTLAFRAPQHDAFFAIDADCVGLTNQIPWSLNRQWLDLLARSGTPLFVSISPDALGPDQRSALEQAFAMASQPLPLLEPVDWLQTTEPEKWLAGNNVTSTYDWFGPQGTSPFAL